MEVSPNPFRTLLLPQGALQLVLLERRPLSYHACEFILESLANSSYLAAYGTSKGAVMNMTRSLALEYRSQGINVNALCPGFLKTAFNNDIYENAETNALLAARGGWGEVGDIAHAAVFLVSDEANWVTGVGMPVDGGYTAG